MLYHYLIFPLLLSVNANLLINGDFEDHSTAYCPSNNWCELTDTNAIFPWTLAKGTSFELDNAPWRANSGSWSMDLSASNPYSIAQNVGLQVGQTYSVSYYISENNCGPVTNHTGYIIATGAPIQAFWHSNSVQGSAWEHHTYTFTATSATTSIEIGSTTASGCGPALDNVVMSIVGPTSNNLLINGDFEQHGTAFCPSLNWCELTDTNAILPWKLSKGASFELDNAPWKAQSGSWSMDLSASAPYSIAQTVGLKVGQPYSITFGIYENNCGPVTNHTGYVSATGTPSQTFWHANSVHGTAWVQVTYTFTATTGNTVIEIGSTTQSGCGPVLDNVILTAVNPTLDLLINGDFEDHATAYCPSNTVCGTTDTDAIYPWTQVKGNSIEMDSSPWAANSGIWSLDLSSDTPYSIAQNVAVQVGIPYVVTFNIFENNCGPVTNHTGYITATGNPVQGFWHSNAVHGSAWEKLTYSFTATSAITSIEIGSTTQSGCGPVLDNVSMICVGPVYPITMTSAYSPLPAAIIAAKAAAKNWKRRLVTY